eukprot:7289890-Pyramimonas_sp.AAC.5
MLIDIQNRSTGLRMATASSKHRYVAGKPDAEVRRLCTLSITIELHDTISRPTLILFVSYDAVASSTSST